MRLAATFVIACVVLAAAQAIAAALLVLLLGALIYGLIRAPKDMLGLIGLMLVAGLIQARPLAFMAIVALMIVAKLIRQRIRTPPVNGMN